MYLTGLFGFCPILYGTIYYFSDMWTYVSTGSVEDMYNVMAGMRPVIIILYLYQIRVIFNRY